MIDGPICRDERCPRIDVHPRHAIIRDPRGRAPGWCPRCGASIVARACTRRCGWLLAHETAPRPVPNKIAGAIESVRRSQARAVRRLVGGAWIVCPACRGYGHVSNIQCALCAGAGRAHRMQVLIDRRERGERGASRCA